MGDGPTRRLLVLSHRVPFPPHNGAALRTFNILRLLARDFDITGLCFDRVDPATAHLPLSDRLAGLAPYGRFSAYPIPQEHSRARLGYDHARSVISGRPYTWYTHDSAPFVRRLTDLLRRERFDLVHVDSLDLVRMLSFVRDLPVVCTHHNVESSLLRRRAVAAVRGGQRAYYAFQAKLVERAEREWLPRVQLNIAVSSTDAAALAALAPRAQIAVVPNGVDVEYFTPRDGPQSGCVFVGGTGWHPNRDALEWFASAIAPRLAASGDAAVATWVGRATEGERRRYDGVPGVRLTGYVDDVRPYLAAAACFIAPLRVGGGTRLKLLDAWAMGKAIVSTSIGAEGLDARHNVDILLADTEAAFAEAIASVLGDAGLRDRLGRAGRRTAEERFSWSVIARQVRDLYLSVADGHVVADGKAG